MIPRPGVKAADSTTMIFETIKSVLFVTGLFIVFQLINIVLMDKLYNRDVGTIIIVIITIGAMVKVHLIYSSAKKQILDKINREIDEEHKLINRGKEIN